MAGLTQYLGDYYNRTSQGAVPPTVVRRQGVGVGFPSSAPALPPAVSFDRQTVGTPTDTFGKTGLFGDVKPGQSGDYRGFTATRGIGGLPDVVAGRESSAGAIDNLLNRGYSLPDSTSAVTGAAASDFDRTKIGLLPGSTAADITKTRSESSLLNAQATALPLTVASEIGLRSQQGGLYGAQANAANAGARDTGSVTALRDSGAYVDANGNQVSPDGRVLARDPVTGLFKLKTDVVGHR